MFDIDTIRTAVLAKVTNEIRRYSDGEHRLEYDVVPRCLLTEEARRLSASVIGSSFRFDPLEFPAYVGTLPGLLKTFVDDGNDLVDVIDVAVRENILDMILPDVFDLLFASRKDMNLEGMLIAVEKAMRDDLERDAHFDSGRLRRMVERCRYEPRVEVVTQFHQSIWHEAATLEAILPRLSVEDPLALSHAARGRRTLLEASDVFILCSLTGTSNHLYSPRNMTFENGDVL